jgi:hypothetical protein
MVSGHNSKSNKPSLEAELEAFLKKKDQKKPSHDSKGHEKGHGGVVILGLAKDDHGSGHGDSHGEGHGSGQSKGNDSHGDSHGSDGHGLESELTSFLEGEEYRRSMMKRFMASEEVQNHFKKAHGGHEEQLVFRSAQTGKSIGDDLQEGEWRAVGEKKDNPAFAGYQSNKDKDPTQFTGYKSQGDNKFGGYLREGQQAGGNVDYGMNHQNVADCGCGQSFEEKDGFVTQRAVIPGQEGKEGYGKLGVTGGASPSYGNLQGSSSASYGSFGSGKSNIYK